MIKKYRLGKPIQTDAVLTKIQAESRLPVFLQEEGSVLFSCELQKDAAVYGLGEQIRGINKRGWKYVSCCTDDGVHTEEKHSMYGVHNFLVVEGEEPFGLFADYPGFMTFDIGYTHSDRLQISVTDKDLDFYYITGETVPDIIRQFRQLIGRSYIPPKWAFGFGQSRWGYKDAADIRTVADGYQKNGIPLDMIYLDIDYMDHYKDFTVDEAAFPDFEKFVEEMRARGIRLIPIIDAGVKIEKGYSVYEEGAANDYFCKDADGNDFVAGVWPGRVHFPDMMKPETRTWFGHCYRALIEKGIEGFWNDMNEPAIFYSEKHLEEVFDRIGSYRQQNLDIKTFQEFQGLVAGINNNIEDYDRFFHEINGEKTAHTKVHNIYGFQMTRAAGEAFEEMEPEKRLLLFSRSSYIGMHRYGGIWMGDNQSWWSHILLNLKMLPSLNMCGILYTGADIGGFSGDTTEDLVIRWTEFGIFTPLMRNHTAIGTRNQEAYVFDHPEIFRDIIGLRYALIPYLYSEFMKAALHDEMMFRPISFLYPKDSVAKQVEDQLFVGESIMIAPVYTQNAKGRYVYLPERMKLIRFRSADRYTETVLEAGHHYVELALEEVAVFIRFHHVLPLAGPAQNMEALDEKDLLLLSFTERPCEYILYHDDGYGRDYEKPAHYTTLRAKNSGERKRL
ncbi:MAG TPA: glycoside hydrolase family 31 protein [Lachnospiraceae bacterium]|nr:glycoside hydrolase family 31 protein [Lachnospiraceae bacterium]